MAKKEEKSTVVKTIEEWRKELGIKNYIHAGAFVQARWGEGKVCTQKKYEKAINEFLYSTPDEKAKIERRYKCNI